LDLIDVLLQ